jgi:hypothetical protein
MSIRYPWLHLAVLLMVATTALPAKGWPIVLAKRSGATAPAVVVQQSAPPCVGAAGPSIRITNTGPSPSVVRVVAGELVAWLNQTTSSQRLVIGQSYRLYLPLITRATNRTAAGEGVKAGDTPGARTAAGLTIDIPPARAIPMLSRRRECTPLRLSRTAAGKDRSRWKQRWYRRTL